MKRALEKSSSARMPKHAATGTAAIDWPLLGAGAFRRGDLDASRSNGCFGSGVAGATVLCHFAFGWMLRGSHRRSQRRLLAVALWKSGDPGAWGAIPSSRSSSPSSFRIVWSDLLELVYWFPGRASTRSMPDPVRSSFGVPSIVLNSSALFSCCSPESFRWLVILGRRETESMGSADGCLPAFGGRRASVVGGKRRW